MPDAPLDIDRLRRETFVAAVEHHATIGSTNDRARQCAARAAGPLPLLIDAEVQTAGRGRGNNRWWAGPGSLTFTLLVDVGALGVDRRWWSLVGIAAGVAVVRTVAPRLPGHRVGLCWPNDVYAARRKLAGILVEIFGDRLHGIGIGLNANNSAADAPADLKDLVVTLRDLSGVCHDRTDLLAALLANLESCLRRLADAPERIGIEADALCLQHGRELTLDVGNQRFVGRCAGISPDGALLLDLPSGQQKFPSGVVIPPAGPSPG